MIEKLKPYPCIDANGVVYSEIQPGCQEMTEKINELVDAVNSLRDDCNLLMGYIAPENKCEPTENATISKEIKGELAENTTNSKMEYMQDKFAEQRKWIGKICKFWNWDTGLAHYSKLITIKDINDGEMSKCPFRADDGGWYMYCEPVKPDDDIIYKGE